MSLGRCRKRLSCDSRGWLRAYSSYHCQAYDIKAVAPWISACTKHQPLPDTTDASRLSTQLMGGKAGRNITLACRRGLSEFFCLFYRDWFVSVVKNCGVGIETDESAGDFEKESWSWRPRSRLVPLPPASLPSGWTRLSLDNITNNDNDKKEKLQTALFGELHTTAVNTNSHSIHCPRLRPTQSVSSRHIWLG